MNTVNCTHHDIEIDTFTLHYLIAALWSSVDDEGDPLDHSYCIEDFSQDAIKIAKSDCERFQKQFVHELLMAYQFYDASGMSNHPEAGSPLACAGHDFWLTRNGHGCGFWDRGMGDLGRVLTAQVGYHTDYPPVDVWVNGETNRIELD